MAKQQNRRNPIAHYEQLSSLIHTEDLLFMNHGYAKLRGPNEVAWLGRADRKHRYHAQFLDQLIRGRRLVGADILDVGSGRGGNCRLLTRYFQPRSVIGLDLSKANIRFCRRAHHDEKRLRFVLGDAMSLPFEANTFDCVLNVESSHCYPNLLRFFEEAWRVLRPGGAFCYTDCMAPVVQPRVSQCLEQVGFEISAVRDVRRNVVAALEANSLQYKRILQSANGKGRELGLRIWRSIMTEILPRYRAGHLAYSLWVLKKPG